MNEIKFHATTKTRFNKFPCNFWIKKICSSDSVDPNPTAYSVQQSDLDLKSRALAVQGLIYPKLKDGSM